MRTLVHLSDLHFGRVDAALVEPLIDRITQLKPDVVIVSGDLTQRARRIEFDAAAEFLARLPHPRIVIPGNHDIALYNLGRRFLLPLARFQRYIEADPMPTFVDDEIAVVGVNSSRSLVIKSGRVNAHQIGDANAVFASVGPHVVKMLVTHHPLQVAPGAHHHGLRAANTAWAALAAMRIDIFLAGHLHEAGNIFSSSETALGRYRSLLVSAGTATSTRQRGERNAFNLLQVDGERLVVCQQCWEPVQRAFLPGPSESFVRGEHGWAVEPTSL